MANYYRAAYKKSKNTLKQICELFRVDSSDITIKFIVICCLDCLFFILLCKFGNPGGDTPNDFFCHQYIVVWWIGIWLR